VFAELAPRFSRPLAPALSWRSRGDSTGQHFGTNPMLGDVAKLAAHGAPVLARWIYNVTVGLALRAVGWMAALFARKVLLNTLVRSLSSTGLGLPDQELRQARIEAVSIPSLNIFFDHETWDATES